MSATVTRQIYERMYMAYSQEQTPAYVAKTVGVSWPTAKKYITEGDLVRDMEPIIDRYRRTMRTLSKLTEDAVARDYAQMVKATLPKLDKLDTLIHEALDNFTGMMSCWTNCFVWS